MMSGGFVKKELRLRQDRYAIPQWQQVMLQALNDRIAGLDDCLGHHIRKESSPPVIMILGLPRSWTTLCVQLVYSAFDVKTVTNIAARFWRAPVTGMMLSLSLDDGKRDVSFSSLYGKTTGTLSPHEFSYFWHHWFKMHDMPPYDPIQKDKEIDWQGFHQVLADMAGITSTPLVLKAMDAVYHLPRLYEMVRRGLFIWVERDLGEIAVSLAKGRLDYYGNLDTWFSIYPLEYEKIIGLPWYEQVAGQVYGLWKLHEEQLAKLDGERIMRISYKDVCNNPVNVLDMIANRLEYSFGVKVRRRTDLPDKLTPHKTELDADLSDILIEALHKRFAHEEKVVLEGMTR